MPAKTASLLRQPIRLIYFVSAFVLIAFQTVSLAHRGQAISLTEGINECSIPHVTWSIKKSSGAQNSSLSTFGGYNDPGQLHRCSALQTATSIFPICSPREFGILTKIN